MLELFVLLGNFCSVSLLHLALKIRLALFSVENDDGKTVDTSLVGHPGTLLRTHTSNLRNKKKTILTHKHALSVRMTYLRGQHRVSRELDSCKTQMILV